jgi:hypothetical protein
LRVISAYQRASASARSLVAGGFNSSVRFQAVHVVMLDRAKVEFLLARTSKERGESPISQME